MFYFLVLYFLVLYNSALLLSAVYFHVLLLNFFNLFVYDENEWVDFFVLGLLDESNDLILSNQAYNPNFM